VSKETKVEAIFIRHGQSTANAGAPTDNFALIPLTQLGREQAETLAASWAVTPGLIVVSPYLRAQQTAEPTIARFPQVPVETWDIYEFTYWDPANWDGGDEDEDAWVERFWREADAERTHGGAENFRAFLGRAKAALARLAELDVDGPVMLFTHGHFIQALRHAILFEDWSAHKVMGAFRENDARAWVRNTQVVRADWDGKRWTLEEPKVYS
jgi:broad specificity phosphatase PhoE